MQRRGTSHRATVVGHGRVYSYEQPRGVRSVHYMHLLACIAVVATRDAPVPVGHAAVLGRGVEGQSSRGRGGEDGREGDGQGDATLHRISLEPILLWNNGL